MNRYRISAIAVSLLLMGSTLVMADGFGGPPPGRGNRQPPPEAIAACKDMNEGAEVEIATPRGDKLKAVCRQINGQLVAVPEGAMRGPGEAGNRQQTPQN
jgi:hypothetical protein